MDCTKRLRILQFGPEFRRIVVIIAISCGIIGNICGISGSAAVFAADPVRVTTSFDVRYAGAVLHQVARLFSTGFGRAEADRVAREIDGLKPDEPKTWRFEVQYRGKSGGLEIRALMDDLGMIDLDFAVGADAAPAVREAVDSYLNGRGRGK